MQLRSWGKIARQRHWQCETGPRRSLHPTSALCEPSRQRRGQHEAIKNAALSLYIPAHIMLREPTAHACRHSFIGAPADEGAAATAPAPPVAADAPTEAAAAPAAVAARVAASAALAAAEAAASARVMVRMTSSRSASGLSRKACASCTLHRLATSAFVRRSSRKRCSDGSVSVPCTSMGKLHAQAHHHAEGLSDRRHTRWSCRRLRHSLGVQRVVRQGEAAGEAVSANTQVLGLLAGHDSEQLQITRRQARQSRAT